MHAIAEIVIIVSLCNLLQNISECYCCIELEGCVESMRSDLVLEDFAEGAILKCITLFTHHWRHVLKSIDYYIFYCQQKLYMWSQQGSVAQGKAIIKWTEDIFWVYSLLLCFHLVYASTCDLLSAKISGLIIIWTTFSRFLNGKQEIPPTCVYTAIRK